MNGFPSSRNCDCHLVPSHPNQRRDAAQSRAQKREAGATTNLFCSFPRFHFSLFLIYHPLLLPTYLFLPFSFWVHFSLSLSLSIDFFLYFSLFFVSCQACLLSIIFILVNLSFLSFLFVHIYDVERMLMILTKTKKTDEKCVAGN